MTAIMPLQENETSKSGGRTATTGLTTSGLRLVLTWAAIVIRARAIFLLLLANATASIATTRLAVRHDIVASGIPAKRLIARHSVSGSKLDFQLDDFVPLLIRSITLGD
ncbi:MAG: hypothetical protein WAR41_18090 [Azonexus sp.]